MTKLNRSRRLLLKNASVWTIAATVNSFPCASNAQEISDFDHVQKLDVGVRPQLNSCGVVIFEVNDRTFVTFEAEQRTEDSVEFGTALIEFEGLLTHKTRHGGSESFVDHTVDIDALDCCEIFEVSHSNWLRRWEPLTSSTDAQPRHFIITFLGMNSLVSRGVHFECLAKDIHVDFVSVKSFEEAVAFASRLR
ncbi:hypothetical protein CA13_33550 [Planctomycetes bacterium CA13]|uniref:Uncharacterized protein n=1 Tax=Novipirellula herctigrandis TaxID=2527986 RepID=A0A5C5Z3Y2_9BACT|nr:hypothetical protein CA13_33550 [Planctomycetes bacterium CA13]